MAPLRKEGGDGRHGQSKHCAESSSIELSLEGILLVFSKSEVFKGWRHSSGGECFFISKFMVLHLMFSTGLIPSNVRNCKKKSNEAKFSIILRRNKKVI